MSSAQERDTDNENAQQNENHKTLKYRLVISGTEGHGFNNDVFGGI
jgi:hypothetical protein